MLWKGRKCGMFIKKIKTPKGRVYLQIVEGFRSETGAASHKVIESLGYLDDLDAAHGGKGEEWAKERLGELKSEDQAKPATVPSGRVMEPGSTRKRNVGSLALMPVYEKLGIDSACDAIQTGSKLECSLDSVLRFLIQSRLVDADSRRSSYLKIDQYIENFAFSEQQMYRCMGRLGDCWEQIKDYATRKAMSAYGLDLSLAHYDGCNFYFEIDMEDSFRRKGMSKEGRPEPIVNFAMLSDADLIPVDLAIYPGNESEKGYFKKAMENMRAKHNPGRIIYVADRGLNTGDNIYAALKGGDGYIVGQPILSEKQRKWALNESGYDRVFDACGELEYKRKSWVEDDAVIRVTGEDGKKTDVHVRQKQIVFWSRDFAEKQRMERAKLISKAMAFIRSPKGYTRAKIGDSAAFVKFATFDANGKYVEGADSVPSLDEEAIKRQSELDGYFMVVSSEAEMDDKRILDAYSAQKGQERNFRVSKTYLRIQPAYASREERIKCHVLVCYLTILILRLIEKKVLKDAVPIERIITDLREYEGALIAPNTYFMFKYNETTKLLADMGKGNARLETQTLSGIKKLFKGY